MAILQRVHDGMKRQRPTLDHLKESRRPVIIFGAGAYAYLLYRYLAASSVTVAGIMVDSAYKTADKFMGLKVSTIEESMHSVPDYEIAVGIPNYPPIVEKLLKLGASGIHVLDVPDFLNIPDSFMEIEFIREHHELFDEAYGLFEDELSRRTYVATLNTKVNEDLKYIKPYVRMDHLYFSTTEFPLSADEILLDVGGYTGDSIRDFYDITKGRYRRIISLEPFETSFEELQQNINALGLSNVVALKIGAWDKRATLSFATNEMNTDARPDDEGSCTIEVDTIDRILERLVSPVTLIKMSINGAEYRAISGARETIRRCRPKIAVKMNVKEDFYRLPLLLKDIAPEIKLYLRQRNFMSMMLVLYGIFDS